MAAALVQTTAHHVVTMPCHSGGLSPPCHGFDCHPCIHDTRYTIHDTRYHVCNSIPLTPPAVHTRYKRTVCVCVCATAAFVNTFMLVCLAWLCAVSCSLVINHSRCDVNEKFECPTYGIGYARLRYLPYGAFANIWHARLRYLPYGAFANMLIQHQQQQTADTDAVTRLFEDNMRLSEQLNKLEMQRANSPSTAHFSAPSRSPRAHASAISGAHAQHTHVHPGLAAQMTMGQPSNASLVSRASPNPNPHSVDARPSPAQIANFQMF